MGSGGRMSDSGDVKRPEAPHRAPSDKPPFTLGELKKAIPPHCFKRSLVHSFAYLFVWTFFSGVLYYLAAHYIPLLPRPLSYAAWPAYWIVQGGVQFGLWMVGHDCGHEAFSEYVWVSDTVGFFVHSAVLTPYFSFKYSHRRHHSNANSLENDEAYVPRIKSLMKQRSLLLDNPPGRLLRLAVLVFIGWILYICFNVAGKRYKERFVNHFDPKSPIFRDSERYQILLTDLGLLVMWLGLYKLGMAKGFGWLYVLYFAPLVVVYACVAVTTWLNHTHTSLPKYDSTEWDWLRGSLATLDRDYGALLNYAFFHINDTHVVHHLFSTIPHYHIVEATKSVVPLLGEYYQFDDTPIYKAMWRETTECFCVRPDRNERKNGVFWYEK